MTTKATAGDELPLPDLLDNAVRFARSFSRATLDSASRWELFQELVDVRHRAGRNIVETEADAAFSDALRPELEALGVVESLRDLLLSSRNGRLVGDVLAAQQAATEDARARKAAMPQVETATAAPRGAARGTAEANGRAAASPLRLLTLGELAATCPAEVAWLWDKMIPDGGALVLLSAYMKTGKSTFLGGLLSAAVRGQPFLGRTVKHGPVVLLAVEEHERDVLIRYRAFGVSDGDPLHVYVGRLPDNAATWDALRAAVTELRPVLVVLDTLNRFWSVRDENDNAQVGEHAGRWLDFAREMHTTAILTVHERKAGGEEGRSIRGAGALFALADQALLLSRPKGGRQTQRVLKTIGRYSESPDELLLDYRDRAYTLLGAGASAGDGAGRIGETTEARLRHALKTEPQTAAVLAKAVDCSERMVWKLVEAMPDVVVEGEGKKGNPKTARLRP